MRGSNESTKTAHIVKKKKRKKPLFLHPWAQLECEPLSQMRRQAQVSLKFPHWITDSKPSREPRELRNVSWFASSIMHLWFSWEMWSSAPSQAIPWWPPMGRGRPCLPAPSGTSSYSCRMFLLHPPSLSPLPSSTQALAQIGWTHPLVLKPTHPWRDSQSKWERCADQRDHLFYYRMALPQHSIKLFSVEIRPNSGSSPGHGCQDRIEKHLAGQFEVLGLAMKEIYFQPCVPGSHLPS